MTVASAEVGETPAAKEAVGKEWANMWRLGAWDTNAREFEVLQGEERQTAVDLENVLLTNLDDFQTALELSHHPIGNS